MSAKEVSYDKSNDLYKALGISSADADKIDSDACSAKNLKKAYYKLA